MNELLNVLRNGIVLENEGDYISRNRLECKLNSLVHDVADRDAWYAFNPSTEIRHFISNGDIVHKEDDDDYYYFSKDNHPKITKSIYKILKKVLPDNWLK